MAGDDEIEGRNRDDEQLHYNSTNLPLHWHFSNPNELSNTSMSMVSTIWDHNATISQNLGGFCDMNLQNNQTTSSLSGFRKDNLDMCWVSPNSEVKTGGSMFIPPAASALLPHSLSQFPADSGFIERAARLSSLTAGNFGDMINPFGNVPESSLNPYTSRPIQRQPQDSFVGNEFKSVSGIGSKHMPLSVDCVADESQPKQGGSGFSGNNGSQDEDFNEGTGSKKRRRSDQYNQRSPQSPNEATKNNNEFQPKGENNPNKSSGKQVSQSSDAQIENYIHVRARRGQATNSHSLAERVRREKISERMKFLQDLVPGCSKVTGKAVMLDEIINYVQSLQRQVEFLSMKLATVNPRMDFNLEGLLSKDMLDSRAGPPGTIGFGADMAMSYNHNQSQMALMQGGSLGVGSSSEAVRRTINSQLLAISGGYKDHTSDVPSSWDDELHNIVQMGLNPGTPNSSQNLGSTPPCHLKAEP